MTLAPSLLLQQLEPLCVAGQHSAALQLAQRHSPSPDECFYLALAAFAAAELGQALTWAERAQQLAPQGLFAAAVTYLKSVQQRGKRAVYLEPAAFSAFIRAGSNQRLYRATSAALGAIYRQLDGVTLLDIGAGDGMALLPALNAHVAHVIALEPSPEMRERVTRGLRERGLPFQAVPGTIQEYMARTPAPGCQLAQATFSLQSLPRGERAPVWSWLRRGGSRVLLVEFDVPDAAQPFAVRWVGHVLERYRQGLLEHAAEPEVVHGFLLPVMFGYFDPTALRTNFEQPRAEWVAELQASGFRSVRSLLLDQYWWAPAYLFDAQP